MDQYAHEQLVNPACPWYSLKSLRLPNLKWCEAQLCSWVEEPANAWSNLAFIFLGVFMIYLARDLKSRALRFYGPGSIIIAFTSFAYHASNNFVMQILDFFGMYVFCYLLLLVNLQRLGKNVIKKSFATFWSAVFGTTLFTVLADLAHIPIQGIVVVLIFLIVGTEFRVKQKSKTAYPMHNFYISMTLMLVAFAFSFSDHQRILCDPENHWFQGHAVWHLVSAFALLFSFFHHRQFDAELTA